MDFTYIENSPHLMGVGVVNKMVQMYTEFKEEESGKSENDSYADYRRARRIDAVYRFVEYILQSREYGTPDDPMTWDDFETTEQNDLINYIVSKFYIVKGTSKIFDYLGYPEDKEDTSLLGLKIVGSCMYDGRNVEVKFSESTSALYPDEVKFSLYLTDFLKCLLFISDESVDRVEYYADTVEGRRMDIKETLGMNISSGIRVYRIIRAQ